MARKRRLPSDSEGEDDAVETQEQVNSESSRSKKKRISSANDDENSGDMEQDSLNCSQRPDFTVSTVSHLVCLHRIHVEWTFAKFKCHSDMGFALISQDLRQRCHFSMDC